MYENPAPVSFDFVFGFAAAQFQCNDNVMTTVIVLCFCSNQTCVEQGMEKVIVRDFYPDLPRLRAQAEYLEAVETNDVEKLREIHIKFGPKHSATASPSICESFLI